jgi:hypothetical protein
MHIRGMAEASAEKFGDQSDVTKYIPSTLSFVQDSPIFFLRTPKDPIYDTVDNRVDLRCTENVINVSVFLSRTRQAFERFGIFAIQSPIIFHLHPHVRHQLNQLLGK